MPRSRNKKEKQDVETSVQSEQTYKWYEEAEALDLGDVSSRPDKPISLEAVGACRKRAEDVLEQMGSKRSSQKALGNDEKWLHTVMGKGTLTDKISAMSLLVADQPLLHLNTLNSIVAMCSKNNRRESGMAIRATKDLFLYNLLPPRKLKSFADQPLHLILSSSSSSSEEGVKDSALVYWLLEDQIKRRYAEYVQILEKNLATELAYVKKQILMIIWELLTTCAEQEQQLLAILVNKLGDPDRKVGSKVVYLLSETLTKHPGMKLPVVKEIERILFRPNVSMRSQYFATIFLNQMLFNTGDGPLADRLIKIYLGVFNHYLARGTAKKDSKEAVAESSATRLLSALLTGVNRAFPYADANSTVFAEQANALFAAVHQSSFNTGIQALLLLYQVMNSQSSSSARFYRAVYNSLLNPLLQNSSKHSLFLNLLFKTMKNDTSATRVAAFTKRLLQICTQHAPPFVCSALYLLSEVSKTQATISALVSSGTNPEDEEERFQDENALKPIPNPDLAQKEQEYDATKRDPAFANALRAPLWELTQLANHYHPSVRNWVSTLLAKEHISYRGEPLHDFTSSAFLDRFVCRNPTKVSEDKKRQSRLHARRKGVVLPASAVRGHADAQSMFYKRYYEEKEARDGGKPKKTSKRDEEKEMDDFADELMEQEVANNERADPDDSEGFDPGDFDYSEDEKPQNQEDDSDDDDGLLDDDSDAEDDNETGSDSTSVFAAAEDFQHLLDGAPDVEATGQRPSIKRKTFQKSGGKTGQNKKQKGAKNGQNKKQKGTKKRK